jgi:hypothetical protein
MSYTETQIKDFAKKEKLRRQELKMSPEGRRQLESESYHESREKKQHKDKLVEKFERGERIKKKLSNMGHRISSSLKKKLGNRQVIRAHNTVTIVENQPVYSRDKSRFFKTAWEEERRQLYFK